jgi:hypothetical protein
MVDGTGWCGGACARGQSHSNKSEVAASARASVWRTMRGKEGWVVVTWIRERITWYGYVAQSVASFDAPDMAVCVLDCIASKNKREKASHVSVTPWAQKSRTHQFIVLHRSRAPEFGKPPPLALKRPAFHLLICHKLQHAVTDAHQRERHAAVEPAPTLVAVYQAEPA